MLERKAADRIIELHGRESEIGEHDIHSFEARPCQHLWQAREIAAVRRESFGPETQRTKPGLSFRQLNGIGVDSKQASSRLDVFEQLLGVAAVPERAVGDDFSRLGGQYF